MFQDGQIFSSDLKCCISPLVAMNHVSVMQKTCNVYHGNNCDLQVNYECQTNALWDQTVGALDLLYSHVHDV